MTHTTLAPGAFHADAMLHALGLMALTTLALSVACGLVWRWSREQLAPIIRVNEELTPERRTTALVGWKLGFLVVDAAHQRAAYRGISIGAEAPYGADGEARCVRQPEHLPPVRGCSCGFYAFHEQYRATKLWHESEHGAPRYAWAHLLRVEGLGRYSSYVRGFRVSRQRIVAATAPPCHLCSAPAEVFGRQECAKGNRGWITLAPLCRACVPGQWITLEFDEVGRLLGTPVRNTLDLVPVSPGALAPTVNPNPEE